MTRRPEWSLRTHQVWNKTNNHHSIWTSRLWHTSTVASSRSGSSHDNQRWNIVECINMCLNQIRHHDFGQPVRPSQSTPHMCSTPCKSSSDHQMRSLFLKKANSNASTASGQPLVLDKALFDIIRPHLSCTFQKENMLKICSPWIMWTTFLIT